MGYGNIGNNEVDAVGDMKFARSLVERLMGVDLRKMDSSINEIKYNLGVIGQQVDVTNRLAIKDHELIKSQRDDLVLMRNYLHGVRISSEYEAAFRNSTPLISICIATYNKGRELVEIALQSVFEQTYQNFEIIIVGDACTDDTESRIEALKDKRITFINLPNRGPYPEDRNKRWMVAGTPGANLAIMLAHGEWIARLDDDDAWSKDHLEKLVKLALDTKSEFVYGALERKNVITGKSHTIYDSTPSFGQISFQGVLYLKQLNFFHYDQQSFLVDEPTDWNLIRRMVSSGIRYASTSDIVGVINWTPNTNRKHR